MPGTLDATDSMTTTAPPLVALGTRPRVADYLRSLWDRREFALAIPRAELQAQHRNNVLGGLWHLLDPFILIGIYYLLFGVLLDVTRGTDNLIAFLAIGVFAWHFTTKSLRQAARSIATSEGLVRAIAFPRAILPLSAVIAEFLAFLFAIVAMFVTVLLTGEDPSWHWLLIAPILALQLLFNIGFGMFLARVADHFRDVIQILPYTLRLIGYMSGVLFPIERRLEDLPVLQEIMQFNPAYLIMELPRKAIMENQAPTLKEWAVLAGWAVGATILGFFFFIAREHEYGRA